MVCQLLIQLLVHQLAPQAATLSVSEHTSTVQTIASGGGKVNQRTYPFHGYSGGKLGWSFDLTSDCRLAFIEIPSSKENRGAWPAANLVLASVLSDGSVSERRRHIKAGHLTSPVFSPDGHKIALIDDKYAVVVDLKTGKEAQIAPGRFAMWEEGDALLIYDFDPAECQVLRRYSKSGLEVVGKFCGGFISLPVASGMLPKGAPIPVVNIEDEVIAFLGNAVSGKQSVSLQPHVRGVACSRGLVFSSPDGKPLSLVKAGEAWSFVDGDVCGAFDAVFVDKGSKKTQHCSPNASDTAESVRMPSETDAGTIPRNTGITN